MVDHTVDHLGNGDAVACRVVAVLEADYIGLDARHPVTLVMLIAVGLHHHAGNHAYRVIRATGIAASSVYRALFANPCLDQRLQKQLLGQSVKLFPRLCRSFSQRVIDLPKILSLPL